jgi:hypothetical protein
VGSEFAVRRPIEHKPLFVLVGVTGFEPATPTSRT